MMEMSRLINLLIDTLINAKLIPDKNMTHHDSVQHAQCAIAGA